MSEPCACRVFVSLIPSKYPPSYNLVVRPCPPPPQKKRDKQKTITNKRKDHTCILSMIAACQNMHHVCIWVRTVWGWSPMKRVIISSLLAEFQNFQYCAIIAAYAEMNSLHPSHVWHRKVRNYIGLEIIEQSVGKVGNQYILILQIYNPLNLRVQHFQFGFLHAWSMYLLGYLVKANFMCIVPNA